MAFRVSRLPLLIVLIIASAVILAACVQIEVESEFDPDGSARHSLTSTVDRSLLDDEMFAGELQGQLDFDEIEQQAEAAGFDVERIDTADRVGVRLSATVEDNEDMGDVLAELFAASGGDSPPTGGFQGGFSESGGFGGSTYRFELTIDGDVLFDQGLDEDVDDELDEELDMDFGMDMMRQFVNLTYTVAMPGEITEHNGNDLGGGRVQWDIPLQGTETFIAESEDGTSFSLALVLGVGIGVLALALIVVGGVMLLRGQKAPVTTQANNSEPAEAEPGPERP